jgi:GNAT superfamily N-acetyltransferase
MIRTGVLSDLEAIVSAQLAMAKETENLELDPATLEEGVRIVLAGGAPGQYWVLEEEGRIVAQLLITHEWSDWRARMVWWIQSVYVLPEHRRGGHFRRLYEEVRSRAQSAGASGLRLYVDTRNLRAQEVYRALGMDGGHYKVFEEMWAD